MAESAIDMRTAVEKTLLALDSTTLVEVLAKVLSLKQLEALNQLYFSQPVENTSNREREYWKRKIKTHTQTCKQTIDSRF